MGYLQCTLATIALVAIPPICEPGHAPRIYATPRIRAEWRAVIKTRLDYIQSECREATVTGHDYAPSEWQKASGTEARS